MKHGEIWLVSLDPTIGAEIKKTRPAIIVNDNALGKLPLKIIVPITDWKEQYSKAPWMIKLKPNNNTKLSKESSADCFQIRSIAEERCVKKIGVLDSLTMDNIRQALAMVLDLE